MRTLFWDAIFRVLWIFQQSVRSLYYPENKRTLNEVNIFYLNLFSFQSYTNRASRNRLCVMNVHRKKLKKKDSRNDNHKYSY
jgi:hypothetical protein